MSENLTDKISETITNVFKKTKVFEKMEKIKFFIGSFFIISSIIGFTNIYINYCNFDRIKNLEEKIKDSENIIKYNIEINRKQNQIIYNKLIDELKNEVEFTSKLIDKLNENQYFKPEMISTSTSISSFSPLRIILSPRNDDWYNHIIMQQDIKEMEDDELIKECYDSIPMNNVKKHTALSWLFN
jgi:hypothetical protein